MSLHDFQFRYGLPNKLLSTVSTKDNALCGYLPFGFKDLLGSKNLTGLSARRADTRYKVAIGEDQSETVRTSFHTRHPAEVFCERGISTRDVSFYFI